MVKESNGEQESVIFQPDKDYIQQQEFNSMSSSIDCYQIETTEICENIQNLKEFSNYARADILIKSQPKVIRDESDKIQKWKKHCK